jgi:alpha-galactosidase/6-phospho-beta-glucosidase family protein
MVQAQNEGGEVTATFTLTVNGPKGTQGFDQENFSIMQNYPNPASEVTYFPYNMIRRDIITIEIININCSVVKTILKHKRQKAGLHLHKVDLNGLNSGIYFIRFISNTEGSKTLPFIVK